MKPSAKHFEAIKAKWPIQGEVKFLRRVENFVYESNLDGRSVILRLTEPKHRTSDEIRAELDWIDYLSKSGMRIAAPISSQSNSFVETFNFGEVYHAAVFEKAKGAPLVEPEDFTLEIFETWGRYIGRMHRLTHNYKPKQGAQPRSIWNEDAGFQVNLRGLDKNDEIPYKRFIELYEWIKSLDTSHDCFGLIHGDLHNGNFFVDSGEITAFDFDDCCYHWFAYDLSIPLYNLLKKHQDGILNFAWDKILDRYFLGYRSENTLDQKWIDRIDLFLKFRVSTVYHWTKASMADGVFDETGLAWCREMLPWGLKQLEPKLKFL